MRFPLTGVENGANEKRLAPPYFLGLRHALGALKYRRGVDRYIAVTEAVKRMLVQDGIAPERIEVIHSGTDLSRFENIPRKEGLRAELGIPEGARVIGNVGFLVGHKAHEYLLEAAAIVLKEIPEAFVVIVGEGERREFLEAKAAELGIAARVRRSRSQAARAAIINGTLRGK